MSEPTAAESRAKSRSTFLLISDFERLEEWCQHVWTLFDHSVGLFLVGSVLQRPDYRDVDLRVMLTDKAFDRFWRKPPTRVRYMNRAISTWGQRETGLPIDFQIQRMTEANEQYGGEPRNALGVRDWDTLQTSGTPR